MAVQSKLCRKCGVTKPRAEFTVRRSGKVGQLIQHCKPCTSAGVLAAYHTRVARDPTLYRRVDWPRKLKRLYGITVDDYHQMLAAQGGGCALCGSPNALAGNRTYKRNTRTAFDVDHDHKTGRVRGLLCTRCNRLVGLAGDNPETARKLVAYLS